MDKGLLTSPASFLVLRREVGDNTDDLISSPKNDVIIWAEDFTSSIPKCMGILLVTGPDIPVGDTAES